MKAYIANQLKFLDTESLICVTFFSFREKEGMFMKYISKVCVGEEMRKGNELKLRGLLFNNSTEFSKSQATTEEILHTRGVEKFEDQSIELFLRQV